MLPLSEAVISLTVVSVSVAVAGVLLRSCAQTLPVSEELSVVTLERLLVELVELPSTPRTPVARVKVASGKVLMV